MTGAIDLRINTDLMQRGLVRWLQEQFNAAGFDQAVLGLSGGLDSAVVCALTAEALGPENVLALIMPYLTSSPQSLADAMLVVEQTGVRHEVIDITPMVSPYLAQTPGMSLLRQGNIMARVRMILLYDKSAEIRGLVVGTGNKTENLLGYSTIHGDGAYAMNPIGDLYKTQVRQLARALGVPQPVIGKPPSADLWLGQTDEGELGFTYDEGDRLLYLLIECGLSTEECIAQGFSASFVQDVIRRMERSKFKRQMPPVALLKDLQKD